MRSLRASPLVVLAFLLLDLPRGARAQAPDDAPPAPAPARDDGHEAAAPIDAKTYATGLRELLIPLRADAVHRLEAKIEASQVAQLDRISEILLYVSLAGLLLLLSPLWLRKRFPGQTGTLFKHSLLASFTFVVAICLFSLALLVLRGTQHAFGAETNPKIALVEGTFHAIDASAEELAPLGPDLI